LFLDSIDVPAPDELPDSLRDLVTRNAIFVRPPPDFNHDIAKLVHSFQRWTSQAEPAQQPTASPLPSSAMPAAPQKRGRWLVLAAIVTVLVAGGWWAVKQSTDAPEYEFAENYFFEDSDPKPASWQPRSRMLGGGFPSPVHYVHWVVIVSTTRT